MDEDNIFEELSDIESDIVDAFFQGLIEGDEVEGDEESDIVEDFAELIEC